MLDLTQLRSFVAVEQMGSFTLAAERLGLGQSTVSQHIQRLETTLGRKLLARDTHRVVLTGDGEALLRPCTADAVDRGRSAAARAATACAAACGSASPEDFVTSQLPDALEEFVRSHPSVDLELTVALSGTLYEMQDNGDLDLVLAKRRLGDVVESWSTASRWCGWRRDPERIRALAAPLPLIAFPAPSVTRAVALEALRRQQVPWRIVCTCGSLSGLTAAARAGMGVLVQPRSMAPTGLSEIAPGWLPALEDVEFVLVPRKGADQLLVSALSEDILAKVRGLRST